MNLENLNQAFAIDGVLRFEAAPGGLVRAQITTAAASATVYLYGAHLTHWQPAHEQPMLFTSNQSPFAEGEASRGGIPVIFPWFGQYSGVQQPELQYDLHGFARITEWTLETARLAGDDLHLEFTLAPNERSRALGFDHFCLRYSIQIGRELKLELAVQNEGPAPLRFEEALHTYFAVGHIADTSVDGLAGTEYLDSADSFTRKRQPNAPIRFAAQTDSIFLDTAAACTIHDESNKRRIVIEKSGSQTTVVWNPGKELAASLPGLCPCDWSKFLCVETANAKSNVLILAPGATHRMTARITLQAE